MEIGQNAAIFDSLPDEIVVSIVAKLGWKDAVKTSIRSHRFHNVWKICCLLKNLDFENFFGKNSRLKFVEFVNHNLHKHEGSKAHSLRIAFNVMTYRETITDETKTKLDYGYENWLRFARAECVESLHIDLCRSASLDPEHCQLGRCTKYFCPQFPILEGWDKLTSLSLYLVKLEDADLELTLKSNLVNLESLHIQNASGLKMFVIKSPKLKKLEFIGCSQILSIDINSAPNLRCFKYGAGPYGESFTRRMVHFKGTPKLSHVSLGGGALCKDNVLKLHKVETLEKLELLDDSKQTMATFCPPFPKIWDNLTALSLRTILVNDAYLEHGLKSCLVNLESLFIQNASHLKRVVVAFPKLKQLEIRDCHNIRSIDIDSAPNLQCFKCQGCAKFKDVPKLSHVSLDASSYCQKSLLELEEVEMLEKLELKLVPKCDDQKHIECMRSPRHFPLLSNLKELECRFVVSEESCIPMIFTVILATCPKLHKLTLNYMTREESGFSWLELKKDRDCWFGLSEDHLRDRSDRNHCLHLCLKEVKLLGGCTEENKVEAVNYLKRIAPNFDANSTL